jgi:Tfp pilus assembly protein PilN
VINLLPPDVKSGYRYALRNVSLRRWALLFVVALIGLGGIATYGLLTLQQSSVQYQKQIADSQTFLGKQKFKETQGQVKDISGSFKLVVQVLSQEVLFSQLLKQIGATIPNNANLTGLSIAQTKGAIDLSAVTTDYKTATQVQVNLADPSNKIFSKADIININCNGANLVDPRYPCVVNIRALFADNNPYLFINSKSTKVKP